MVSVQNTAVHYTNPKRHRKWVNKDETFYTAELRPLHILTMVNPLLLWLKILSTILLQVCLHACIQTPQFYPPCQIAICYTCIFSI